MTVVPIVCGPGLCRVGRASLLPRLAGRLTFRDETAHVHRSQAAHLRNAGLRHLRLPAATAALAGTGLGFFENMPGNSATAGRRWRGSYSDWKETPIAADERHWPVDSRQQSLSSLDYLCRYGFCIEVAAALIRDVDSLINSPGSYYAYGRIGLIVVSPEKRLVVYLYNG
ncbi:hypothetical protein [Ectopseudomonas khazarica]|uniref:hypothetical protein n=1 Tax=Ectopseudomonas khazarica TaxID=2502979 RepID=UPI003A8F358F